MRWDYFGVIGAENNAFSLFDVKTGELETVGASGAPIVALSQGLANFAPRLSLADDLMGNGKLVIRPARGIYYDGPSQDFFVGNQAYNTNAGQAGPAFNNIGFASPVVTGYVPQTTQSQSSPLAFRSSAASPTTPQTAYSPSIRV